MKHRQVPVTPAEAEIRRRISVGVPVTFAEFMDVALYWPAGGYYSGGDPFGASGDYYTSPMAHPAFGALLSVQMFQMWELMGGPTPFTLVELGAGNGLLCRDILSFSAYLPREFHNSLRYLCLDRWASQGHEAGLPQASRIAAAGVPLRGIRGCILSNEYLDAFPVHQVEMTGGKLREVFITLDGTELMETLAAPSTPGLARRLDGLGDVEMAEGQRAEINLGLGKWAGAVSDALDAGFVLTIDYGRPARELYSAQERPRGTLTTYYRHTQTDAPLRRVGRQDISAQVDFTSVMRAGAAAGLATLGLTTQRRFLHHLGWRQFQGALAAAASTQLPPRDRQANLAGLNDLVRPDGLGDFKVLVQGKDVPPQPLWGLAPELPEELAQLVPTLPPPLLTNRHMLLAAGRWPQPEAEFELDLEWLLSRQEE